MIPGHSHESTHQLAIMKLLEIRGAPLYHWMDAKKSLSVFEHDKFTQLWTHETKEGTFKGISFSRNSSFTYGEKPVRLTFDQAKLAARFKIIPLDAERAFAHSMNSTGWYNRKDRKMNSKNSQQYAEEFVIGDIKPLHKFITKIEVTKRASIGNSSRSLIQEAEEYAKKWNIPLELAPEVIKAKEQWKLDDEDDE